jgi:hypothetical protein
MKEQRQWAAVLRSQRAESVGRWPTGALGTEDRRWRCGEVVCRTPTHGSSHVSAAPARRTISPARNERVVRERASMQSGIAWRDVQTSPCSLYSIWAWAVALSPRLCFITKLLIALTGWLTRVFGRAIMSPTKRASASVSGWPRTL